MRLFRASWVALWMFVGAAAAPAAEVMVSFFPESVQNGQAVLVRLQVPTGAEIPADVALQRGDVSSVLFPCPGSENPSRCGFVAFPLDTKAGSHDLTVTWMDNGSRRTKTVAIPVTAGKFVVSRLKVDPDRVHPSEEELKRIQKEKEEVSAAYASGSPTPLWQTGFILPTNGIVTDRFGNRRTFNGQVKSVHLGLDLRAATGTPIQAANTGKVLVAKELFYGGNTVILDHGGGLFSNYGHLSVLKVTPGQTVTAGTVLGEAGATGRVTGPHLHWGARLNGTPVDPREFSKTFNHLWEKN